MSKTNSYGRVFWMHGAQYVERGEGQGQVRAVALRAELDRLKDAGRVLEAQALMNRALRGTT
jgi:hypothetical protein